MTAKSLAGRIERRLRGAGTPERALGEKAYLKSDLEFVGATVSAIRGAVSELHGEQPDLDRSQVVSLVRSLWGKGIHECRMAAVEVLDAYADRLEAGDLRLLEALIRDSGTWALVDGLAATVVGGLIERHPDLADSLDAWAADPDFWVRRSALLALLEPLRRGEGDFERFARYADAMADEKEFFIRKAIGWVLRETGKRRPDLVADWLAPRLGRLSRLTVREAIKYLPEPERNRLALPR